LAFDAALLCAAAHSFARSVFGWLRGRARDFGIFRSQCGAVTFVQRFKSDLRLNLHFHMVTIEGVYTATGAASPQFHELPPPHDSDVADVVSDAARRIQNLLERSGATEVPAEADPMNQDSPALAELAAASVRGTTATGQRQTTLGMRIDPEALDVRTAFRCASVAGYSLHADTRIPAGAPDQLQRLFRYAGRPALAEERLSELPDGRLVYRLKARGGTEPRASSSDLKT
jgi:hypothetical protein